MARILMTQAFSDLDPWPGRLFEVIPDEVSLLTNSTTSFSFSHTDGDFAGYSITLTGTGFAYEGGTAYGITMPSAGVINSVVIRNGSNAVVLTIDQFSGGGLPRDLAQIVSNMFGSGDMNAGPGPDGKITWSHLLQGKDTIVGTSGDDGDLVGVMAGSDLFDMKAGDDSVWVGSGADTVKGGSGFDTLTYASTAYNEGATATRGIVVNMLKGTVIDCWGFTDKFTSVEGFMGSRFNDRFLGNSANNEFAGMRGRDIINGGTGVDQVSYRDDYWDGGMRGIVVDLETSISKGVVKGTAMDGFGQRDTLIAIEEVDGTRFADSITGSRFSNFLAGREGDDTLAGGGGKDTFFWREQDHIGDDDVITDFAISGTSADKLAFETDNFNGMSTSSGIEIGAAATGGVATFVFDSATSILYWDEDGAGGVDQVKIVTLSGVTSLTTANLDLF